MEFSERNLRGARFISSDLSGAVMRGVDIAGAEIDSPWLVEEGGPLFVNGIDVPSRTTADPTFAEVLAALADRQTMVRDYIATVTSATLAETRTNPWAPDRAETVPACLHTILEEEWEHHRDAVRDLDTIQ